MEREQRSSARLVQRTTAGSWLIIDADRIHRERLANELRNVIRQEVATAPCLEDGDAAGQVSPCVIILCADGQDTVSLVRSVRNKYDSATIVLIGYLSALSAFYAARAGADGFAPKPVNGQQLSEMVMGRAAPKPANAELPSLARAEWEYLHSVLWWCKGNRSETARRLKIHRSVLQRKLARTPPFR
jgi:two-component system, response regulator RegA